MSPDFGVQKHHLFSALVKTAKKKNDWRLKSKKADGELAQGLQGLDAYKAA